jgi:hypothetical protein
MNVVLERWSGSHWATALLLAGLLVSTRQAAWAAPHDTDPQTLKDAVERFNHSPEGRYESILLKSGDKLVQVNFPPVMAADVTKAMATGTPPLGDVVAQSNTITRETVTIRETAPSPEVVVRQPPPAPRQDNRPPPPAPTQVWVTGYWTWGNNEWVWVNGRWEQPPERMATWVPGQWTQRGEEWAWRTGHWE